MKIKDGFVLQKVGGSYLAVAVGARADEFSGMVRMNETGAFFWNLLAANDMTEDAVVAATLAEYDASEENVRRDFSRFLSDLDNAGILLK